MHPFTCVLTCVLLLSVKCMQETALMHSTYLDQRGYYLLSWSTSEDVITFETVVQTRGYIGLGFSQDGSMAGSDIMIGWVDQGRAVIQDRFAEANREPELDSQQDWELLHGSQNGTHTVLRFRRKFNTCDKKDVAITKLPTTTDLLIWDLKNSEVLLPPNEDTLYWCKVFRMPPMTRKHHMIRYEPLHQVGNEQYVHHLIVYECSSDDDAGLEDLVASPGHRCYQPNMPPLALTCNSIIAAWAVGSEWVRDSSGLRLYYTPRLRSSDAGVLSVGVSPNWKHLIPPQHPEVTSEGHCIGLCTRQAFPPEGIHVFGVILHSHTIGRRLRLRHVRAGYELPPIARDDNYDFNYQEYRAVDSRVLPGDELITECVYNSSGRRALTLGGLSTREEMCLAFVYYSPRTSLAVCQSVPSLPTVLRSLGINELWPNSLPLKIKSPSSLKNMTLEERLVTYEWVQNFEHFQSETRAGSFHPLCWERGRVVLPGTETLLSSYPDIKHSFVDRDPCRWPSDEDWWRKTKLVPARSSSTGNSSGDMLSHTSSSLSSPRWTNIGNPGGGLIEIRDVYIDAVSSPAAASSHHVWTVAVCWVTRLVL